MPITSCSVDGCVDTFELSHSFAGWTKVTRNRLNTLSENFYVFEASGTLKFVGFLHRAGHCLGSGLK